MNTRGLLDQLLKSGQDMLQKRLVTRANRMRKARWMACSAVAAWAACSAAQGWRSGGGRHGPADGQQKARKFGGKALTYGGLAALGVIAYKAYGNWQAQQASAPQSEPQTIDRLPPAQVEQHSQGILKALVAAAKADGHVDERERALIEGEFTKLDNDRELQSWLHAELNKPWTPPMWPAPQAPRKWPPRCTSPA
ncbi:DUF533 domain-containing protein [Pseudomonas sp. RTB3]|nr:DUF533 domain-containing protein [Pseudomonas sp. RTB3]